MKFNNELLMKGYGLLEDGEVSEACDLWLELWETIKEYIKKNEYNAIEDMDAEIETEESLVNWVQDLEMELENAGMVNGEYYKKRNNFCNEFENLLPESDRFILMNMITAQGESLFEMDEEEESDKMFERAINEHQSSVWPYVKWGDTKWLSGIKVGKVTREDVEKAFNIYSKGKGCLDLEDYEILQDRLKEISVYIK